jgi:hypothetical protein
MSSSSRQTALNGSAAVGGIANPLFRASDASKESCLALAFLLFLPPNKKGEMQDATSVLHLARSFQERNHTLRCKDRKTACGHFRLLIPIRHGDSHVHQAQQVVRGQTATRGKIVQIARFRHSTWQGRGMPPSIASFPSAATGGNGNPAGFHTFPPAERRSGTFMAKASMNASQTPAATRGSGSEKRQRVHKKDTRWDEIEFATLLAAAQATGLTPSGYIRSLVLGCPGPRAQRAPSVNAQALAQATAALNKVGSNLNQIARVLNAGGVHVTAKDCSVAIGDVRAALSCILHIVGREARR